MDHRNTSECKLFYTISTLDTEKECYTFLSEILSPHELKSIENRWHMMILLSEGLTQRYISEQLRVAVSSVSRANRILKTETSFCKQLIKWNSVEETKK